jgi:16S rRNA (cytidine1402-2'-O)-methyltransferase
MKQSEEASQHTLYVVATPIGNLDDISARALSILASVDLILAEDTRETQQLLSQYHINKPIKACHDHNERQLASHLIERLQAGESMALVTDRGTPLISDPGYPLVKACYEAGIRVSPIPGACAMIAALSVAGLPTDRFCFEGFLLSKTSQREKQLQALVNESRTLVFYESPHRIEAMLESLSQVFGPERLVVIAREITKQFETIYRGSCSELMAILKASPAQVKGEFVVCVAGKPQVEESSEYALVEVDALLHLLISHYSLKEASILVSTLTGLKKNALYERALRLDRKNSSHLE